MTNHLLEAVEASDAAVARDAVDQRISSGGDPWEIHEEVFAAAQRALNPPFINPHLPKMYRITRELRDYLDPGDLAPLVRLEVNEYARRPKRDLLPRPKGSPVPDSFEEIQAAIRARDSEKAAHLMAGFMTRQGGDELARRLLLLGSGYLENSLGHAVSCTAFILLEMLGRKEQDPWPALSTLADYFCNGGFSEAPPPQPVPAPLSHEETARHVLRAASGRGIVNLHHTITLYATERVRPLLDAEQFGHMMSAGLSFVGEKRAEAASPGSEPVAAPTDYDRFYELFCELDARSVAGSLTSMLDDEAGRKRLGRFLVKGVCDQYRGDYNPHFLTGLGSALWVVERFWDRPAVAATALYQFVDFFFEGTRR